MAGEGPQTPDVRRVGGQAPVDDPGQLAVHPRGPVVGPRRAADPASGFSTKRATSWAPVPGIAAPGAM